MLLAVSVYSRYGDDNANSKNMKNISFEKNIKRFLPLLFTSLRSSLIYFFLSKINRIIARGMSPYNNSSW